MEVKKQFFLLLITKTIAFITRFIMDELAEQITTVYIILFDKVVELFSMLSWH